MLCVLFVGNALFLLHRRSLIYCFHRCFLPLLQTVQYLTFLVVFGYLADVIGQFQAIRVVVSPDGIVEIIAQEAARLAVQSQGRLEFRPESLVGILACSFRKLEPFGVEASLAETERLLPKRVAPAILPVAIRERGMFLE